MSYRIDVYENNKKIGSHWYKTEKEAIRAKNAILRMRKKKYTFIPGENRPKVTKLLGGWTVSAVIQTDKY